MRFSMALFLALAASAQAATIAIIDTEIDYSHERLSAKMWSAPNENRNSTILNENNKKYTYKIFNK